MRGLTFNRQFASSNYIFDFICRKAKLIIEVDGLTHQFEKVIDKDVLKNKYVKELGFEILHIDDSEIFNNLSGVAQMLENLLEQKGF